MIGERIGILSDGVDVHDRPRSHLVEDEELRRYITEALLSIEVDINAPVKAYVHDFGRVVGEKKCVETTDGDEIFYAQRTNRRGLSRFVRRKNGTETTKLTVVLMKNMQNDEQYYILITGFYGDEVMREPWDKYAEAGSKVFWNTHAFISENADIVSGSETTECPW